MFPARRTHAIAGSTEEPQLTDLSSEEPLGGLYTDGYGGDEMRGHGQ